MTMENKMQQYLALFRAINVGGRNKLPMSELKSILEDLDLKDIQTYIQSGNVIFKCSMKNKEKIKKEISSSIEKTMGFNPPIHLLEKRELGKAMDNNPFPEAEGFPKALHLGFLSEEPENPDLVKMDHLKKESEKFKIIDRVFYLYAPEGIGRSKLAASSERLLGVHSKTDRNWRTVEKLWAMFD